MLCFCVLLIIVGVVKSEFPPKKKCKINEFECTSGQCIPKTNWCVNKSPQCSDRSHLTNCRLYYPHCGNDQTFCEQEGNCIPIKYICDNYKDCANNSDEAECSKNQYLIRHVAKLAESRIKARIWLVKRRRSNWGWQEDSNRAMSSLFLSLSKEYPPGNLVRELMVKQLQIQLSGILMRLSSVPLHVIALYVHASLATCLDPSKFQGYDLVQELENRIDNEYVNPLVALAICNSNGTISDEIVFKLIAILNKPNTPQWLESKALASMALICIYKNGSRITNQLSQNASISNEYSYIIENAKEMFESLQQNDGSFGNLYTTAYIVQVLFASDGNFTKWDVEKSLKYIISKQEDDGSFVDILATYLVLPILYGRTLVDLRNMNCSQDSFNRVNVTVKEELDSLTGKRYRVEYLIYVGENKDITFGITLNVPENVTFYDVMRLAAELDNRFRFEYTEYPWGKYVYSMFSISNDAEARKYWQLHQITKKLIFLDKSPDKVLIRANVKFVYWYKLGNHFTTGEHAAGEYD